MKEIDWEIKKAKETLIRFCKYKFLEDEVVKNELKQILRTVLIMENKLKKNI